MPVPTTARTALTADARSALDHVTPPAVPAQPPMQDRPKAAETWQPRRIKTLILPCDYLWLPEPITQFDTYTLRREVKYETRNQLRTIAGTVQFGRRYDKHGRLRPIAALADAQGHRIWVAADPEDAGALYDLAERHNGGAIALFGRLYQLASRHWFIEYPEPVPSRWFGAPRPIYNLHFQTARALANRTDAQIAESYLLDQKIQNEYRRSIDDLEAFRSYLRRSASALMEKGLECREERYVATGQTGIKEASNYIKQVLTLAHKPHVWEGAEDAMQRIDRIAATCVMSEQVRTGLSAQRTRLKQLKKIKAPGLPATYRTEPDAFVARLTQSLPFALTDEQMTAVHDILADLDAGYPMRRILSGDVGTGKTAVYAVPVAAMLAAGHQVGVMLPQTMLAHQVYEKLLEFIPGVRASLATQKAHQIDPDAQLWVGTVGIHSLAPKDFDFFIVDEQHRFSREQRERTLHDMAHLLEVTATCIPRTQALMDAQIIDVSTLKTCHVRKKIITNVHAPERKNVVFRNVRRDVAEGYVTIIVFPGREQDSSDRAGNEIHSVKRYAPLWEKHFPGQVAVCHGDKSDDDNQAAIDAIKRGDKPLLLATSIIEVGIDLERVRRVVIVQPERFGLATLHQLRGRAVREGGTGYCDLLLVGDVTPESIDRLRYMERTSDGFELATYDLQLRGSGDTTSTGQRQHGATPDTPFPDRDTPHAAFSRVAGELSDVLIRGLKTVKSEHEQAGMSPVDHNRF